ncbi:MAG: DNA-processing protein DprA [Candidatus Calescibacterium sp.]|nr:DNA-protecting protein DprA [Candidatus Calescibacterium sp.]MCX7972496.1 DNA-protecting protein DprA [bacterium]MDW8195612.1 DNA-processing protein DprA [Candidatus Calescibacterium sp.]
MSNTKKKLIILYLFAGYNFFKVKKLILENRKDDLQTTLYYLIQKLKINEEEILKKYNTAWSQELENTSKVFFEEDFPDFLYENNAGVVFYKGNWNLLRKDFFRISIVGSRKPLDLTHRFLEDMIKFLAEFRDNIVIVSGLAMGVDTIALKNSILNNINTIAILGNGIQYYYPYSNRFLQQDISNKGLIFSEYLPNQHPNKYFFPYRNRLISCVSEIVIVCQASKNSGSSITGRYALEMGKTLIVPYLSNSEDFEGSKELINSGGIMITKPSEIIDYLPFLSNKKSINNTGIMSNDENLTAKILQTIKDRPGITVNDLASMFQLPISKVLEILTALEIDSKIYMDFNYSVFIK